MYIQKLKEQLEKIVRSQNELQESAVDENGDPVAFTEDQQTEFDRLQARADELKKQIDVAVKVEENKRAADDLDVPVNSSPRIQVTREEDFNEDGEYRGFKSFGEQLGAIARAEKNPRAVDKRLEVMNRAASGANEDVGAEGGFAVQSDFAMQLFSSVKDAGQLAPRCNKIPTSKNSVVLTLLDETSKAIGSQYGGVRAYWRAEAGSTTATKPKYRQQRVEAESLAAIYRVTDELLSDAPALQSLVSKAFTQAMAFQLDDAIVRGDGAGKPLGILNAPCRIDQAKETSQTADTINFENVDKMVDQVLGDKAVWFAHRTCMRQLRNMDFPGDSSPVWLPKGAWGQQEQTLFGYPLVKSEHCNVVGDLGDLMLLNLDEYLLIEKQGISASESSHIYFLTGEKAFRWELRANGLPMRNSAVTDANGSGTTSPFVALAARA